MTLETLHKVWTPARTTLHAKDGGEVLFELVYEPSAYHSPDPYPWKLVGHGEFDAIGENAFASSNPAVLWFSSMKGAEYRALSEFIEAQARGEYHVE